MKMLIKYIEPAYPSADLGPLQLNDYFGEFSNDDHDLMIR